MTTKNNPTTSIPGHKLVITRDFDAPRELVWKAWTEPRAVKGMAGTGRRHAH